MPCMESPDNHGPGPSPGAAFPVTVPFADGEGKGSTPVARRRARSHFCSSRLPRGGEEL